MDRDYEKWHSHKKVLDQKKSRVFFHEGEIWWCAIGSNIGIEEDGKNDLFERPVVVFRKFNKEVFLGIPITSIKKEGKFYFNYTVDSKDFSVILSQIRLYDAKRLLRKIRSLSKEEYVSLDHSFKGLLEQTIPPHGRDLGGRSRL
ncbi:MAG: type II toxin-antitoxin system PemK/MazF family toxin [Patescibacteria group bacterium]